MTRLSHVFVLPLLLCAAQVLAAPDAAPAGPPAAVPAAAPGQTVLQLLHDKGLLPHVAEVADQVQANAIVQQVRDTASGMVSSAMNFLGVRYRRGGSSAEQGFDCSGFTRYVFENSIGRVLPRRADQQAQDGRLQAVKKDELRPGDLVFFNTMRRAFSHVGIYVGDGKFIHAPRSGSQVRIEDMGQSYWAKRFNGARRADTLAAPGVTVGSGPGLNMQDLARLADVPAPEASPPP